MHVSRTIAQVRQPLGFSFIPCLDYLYLEPLQMDLKSLLVYDLPRKPSTVQSLLSITTYVGKEKRRLQAEFQRELARLQEISRLKLRLKENELENAKSENEVLLSELKYAIEKRDAAVDTLQYKMQSISLIKEDHALLKCEERLYSKPDVTDPENKQDKEQSFQKPKTKTDKVRTLHYFKTIS